MGARIEKIKIGLLALILAVMFYQASILSSLEEYGIAITNQSNQDVTDLLSEIRTEVRSIKVELDNIEPHLSTMRQ